VSPMVNGSKPTDGGNLILSAEEKSELIVKEPLAEQWMMNLLMA